MFSENSPKVSEMSDASDAAVAKSLIADTFDLIPGRRSIVIGLVIAAVKRVERSLSPEALRARPRQWTERRVRSIVDEEARRIDAYEIEDLKKVAIEIALAEARLDFQKSTKRAAWLAAFLAQRDPSFHGEEIAFQAQVARGAAGAGDRGADAGSDRDGTADDRRSQCDRRVAGAGDQHHRAGDGE